MPAEQLPSSCASPVAACCRTRGGQRASVATPSPASSQRAGPRRLTARRGSCRQSAAKSVFFSRRRRCARAVASGRAGRPLVNGTMPAVGILDRLRTIQARPCRRIGTHRLVRVEACQASLDVARIGRSIRTRRLALAVRSEERHHRAALEARLLRRAGRTGALVAGTGRAIEHRRFLAVQAIPEEPRRQFDARPVPARQIEAGLAADAQNGDVADTTARAGIPELIVVIDKVALQRRRVGRHDRGNFIALQAVDLAGPPWASSAASAGSIALRNCSPVDHRNWPQAARSMRPCSS